MDKENIIINRYFGGLGNQMFQYVFELNLRQGGKHVIADTSWYDEEISHKVRFCLDNVFPSISINRDVEKIKQLKEYLNNRSIGTRILNRLFPNTCKVYTEKKEFEYDGQALGTKKVGVSGYWQCHKYVDNVSEGVREQFVFGDSLPSEAQAVLEHIENSNTVFVHIRGGDYIKELGVHKLFGGICTSEYYHCAISMMRNRLHNPLFLVFTNDKRYAKSILEDIENIYFVSDYFSKPYEDWIDLMMMSKCKHAIIANSSFSWWGAWLIENRDKVVIAPEKWMNREQRFDICEPCWIRL